jgi:hypothetical protein
MAFLDNSGMFEQQSANAVARANTNRASRRVSPCPACHRAFKGQGGAYFGPACTAGDACCTEAAASPARDEAKDGGK